MMENKSLNEIINGYSWIKVKYLPDADLSNPETDWKSEYLTLNIHHKRETEFLINMCRNLASKLLENETNRK